MCWHIRSNTYKTVIHNPRGSSLKPEDSEGWTDGHEVNIVKQNRAVLCYAFEPTHNDYGQKVFSSYREPIFTRDAGFI